jgi:DNA-binding transcriptional LysR family regulator
MRAFVRVAEAGSFVRAAGQLAISTTSVSRQVADLEAHLGARLLNRTTRRLALTDTGRAYLDRARALLEDLDEAEAAAAAATREVSGRLRVNAPLSFGTRHLAPLIARYCEAHPRVELDVTLSDRIVDLVEEGYDLAVRIAAELNPTLVARRLAPARLVLVAAPAYLARHGTPRRPADLTRHRCLGYSYLRGGTEWQLGGRGGPHIVPLSGPLTANNGDLLHEAALAGLGIALLPTFLCGDALRGGRLAALLPEHPPPELAIHAVYASRRHLSARVRSFVDYLAAHLGERPAWDRWRREPARR